MPLYEIVNMSDPYTFEAVDNAVAAAAVLILGNGQYACNLEDGTDVPAMLLFTPPDFDMEAWFEKQHGCSFASTMERAGDLCAAYESVLIASFSGRAAYFDALELIDDPAKREEYKARWHDRKRSSMNNIGERAWALAKQIREKSSGEEVPDASPVVLST